MNIFALDEQPGHPLEGLLYDQTNLAALCAERPLDWDEYAHMNEFHGNAAVIKEYAGLEPELPLPFALEHAIPYDLETAYEYDLNCGLPAFLAVREESAAAYRRGGVSIVETIGHTYLYALDLFREKHPDAKKIFRRGTLVFPDKSTLLMDTDFDRTAFAQRLVELPEEFQPVVVCVYWKDHVRGTHEAFVTAGLPVVTCGHLRDAKFQLRLHDLCRRFRYSCANDLAGSFVLSVLSGCHFFYLPTHGLTQKKYGVTSTHDLDPTFLKNDKAACIAASPFPPELPDKQQVLANGLAGVSFMQTPEKLRSLYGDACKLLTDALSPGKIVLDQNTQRVELYRLLPLGLDHDGWARMRCALHLDNPQKVGAIRLHLEFILPQDSGQTIEVRVNGIHLRTLTPPPYKSKVLIAVPENSERCVIELISNKEVPLVGDQRNRAYRINTIELMPPVKHLGMVSSKTKRSSFWRRIARYFKAA